jgi:stage II sporulation protein M
MDETDPQPSPAEAPTSGQPTGFLKRLCREEREAWRGHYRKYFKYAARALGLGFVAGFLFFMLWPAQEKKALALVVKAFKDIPLDAGPAVMALTLFYHNARASIVWVATGIVPFLFLPILDPVISGGVLGLLVSVSRHHGLDVPRLVLTQILPHGVIELAAVLYATSIGLYLSKGTGRMINAAWTARKRRRAGIPDASPEPDGRGPDRLFHNAVRSFVLVVLPLLVIAAFIEGFITPALR